ncbi:TonB-dependent receptor [Phenylobacterium sp.]|uniref:TonB-dependent receptor n=1 Tax=Phenylobacterium sp. TaxID=1871053 RepID=UPI002F401E78
MVTARRREENLQATPVAITAVSAETLEARHAVNLTKVAEIAPNMATSKVTGSLGSAGAWIRGVGFIETTLGQDSGIGIYIDGVYNGRNNIALMDLITPERVEVLRGPQGTLFGRNTTGGAISIVSRTPGDEFGGQVRASYGSYKANSAQVRIDSGLLGNSGIKLSAAYQHRQENGSVDNKLQPSNNDPDAIRSNAFWVKAVGEWGKLNATLSADYNELTGAPNYLQIVAAPPATLNFLALSPTLGGDSYTVTSVPQYTIPSLATLRQQRVWAQGMALTLNYEVNDHLSLKSISSVRGYKRDDSSPNGPANLRGNTGTVAAPVITTFNGIYALDPRASRQHQYTEEVQALGSVGDFEYVVGGFYFHEDGWEFGRTKFPAGITAAGTAINSVSILDYNMVNKSYAGFGQVNWKPAFLDHKLELTGGLRYTKDEKNLDQRSTVVRKAKLETNNTSLLGSVNYQWTEDFMTYARYSTGYRAGGFNVRAGATTTPIFTPEKMRSYETGFKAEMLNRRFRLNGAAFYNKYRGLQLGQFVPPSASGAGGSIALNADARYRGFELEAQAVPMDGLTLTASVGYVDPKYEKFPQPLQPGGVVGAGCKPITGSAGGAAIAMDCAAIGKFLGVSKRTASAGAAYVFPRVSYGEWSIRADYAYRSAAQWSLFNLPTTPFQAQIAGKAYGLLSGRIALSDIPLTGNAKAQLSVYGENLTNEHYAVQGIDFGFMATNAFSKPRTFGVEVKADF